MAKPFLSQEIVSKKIINLEFANPFRIIYDGEFVDFEMTNGANAQIRRLKVAQFHELLEILNTWVKTPEGSSAPASLPKVKPTWKPLSQLKTELGRANKAWSDEECSKAARLLNEGLSYKQISPLLGRTPRAILAQHASGRFPKAPPYSPNKHHQEIGIMSALVRAEKRAQLSKESTQ
jgi:hypothetical protein